MFEISTVAHYHAIGQNKTKTLILRYFCLRKSTLVSKESSYSLTNNYVLINISTRP